MHSDDIPYNLVVQLCGERRGAEEGNGQPLWRYLRTHDASCIALGSKTTIVANSAAYWRNPVGYMHIVDDLEMVAMALGMVTKGLGT